MLNQVLSYVLTALVPTIAFSVLYYMYRKLSARYYEKIKVAIRQELTLHALEEHTGKLREQLDLNNDYLQRLEHKIVSELSIADLNDVIRGLYNKSDPDSGSDPLPTEPETADGSKPQ